ncbi:MAG: hypothetical protein IIB38_03020, partial [Candidatus Hydrogenedentes bacterium]|nr:hypothetical protein [Candidatus Hydrogenedentota bacterium]
DLNSLTEEEKRELREELIPYWKGNGNYEKCIGMHYGHNIIGYEKVLKKGFQGIKKQAEDRLARLDPTDPEDVQKVPFLEGVVMAMTAVTELGLRFAAKARERAEEEADAQRKAELLRIAEVFDRIPAGTPTTFYEAIQTCYLTWMLSLWESRYQGGESVGRVDKYLYPYYEKDLREGRISQEQAQELIDCFLIKLNHAPPVAAVTVGGLNPDGTDATNALSYMIIEGMAHTRLRQPFFSVQVHQRMPDDLLIKACQLCAVGTGHPQFINSDVLVYQALARGSSGGPPMTLEDARSGAPIGCIELGIPGKDSGYLYYGSPNLASAMELVMTNGVSRASAKKIGVETGDPRQFTSFEQVKEAFAKQVALLRKNAQLGGNRMEQRIMDLAPTVYESALIEDCIENGVCREHGGAHYNFNTACVVSGPADAGDSLAVIKKLVFEDKKITMDQLCDALDEDFEGYEDIRNMCLAVPKYGNDDDYVDKEVAWVMHEFVSEFKMMKNMRGGYGCPGGSPMHQYVPLGKTVGALPSGRQAWEPLADSASPSAGKDVNGPTAVFKSVGKIDNVEILGGVILNMRIDPAVFEGGSVERMAGLIRAFIDQKIYHVQVNVVSTDTLKAAQKEPEKYRDLMVKVAGYNAFFTQLSKEHQDPIIARTTHGL